MQMPDQDLEIGADHLLVGETNRRRFLATCALSSAARVAGPAIAQQLIDLGLPGGNGSRPMTSEFPGKGAMILQRVHPPLLEIPMDVSNRSVFTPNDKFFVRWHWANFPSPLDAADFQIRIAGHVRNLILLDLVQRL